MEDWHLASLAAKPKCDATMYCLCALVANNGAPPIIVSTILDL
ncbi:hypothetical protein N7462_007507 [Penicillium macrosclerotiorum]|nr:uncharacterized protein N7462_007507 [Penicillium macrosclerotiorum]KAJ5679263.1 hypothetical protein N7462_007507 [Penicillium macrosclerotiorum]